MWTSVLVAVCSLLLIIVFKLIERRARFKSLEQFPGPQGIPLFGNALDMGSNPVEFLEKLVKFMEQYGTIVQLWIGPRPFLFVSDVKFIEFLLSSTQHIDKSLDYTFMHPWLGTGLLLASGNKWRTRRKIITPAFHFKILEQFVDVFNKTGDIFIEKLSENANQEPVDISPLITRYTLDVICETAMGTSINCQNNTDSEYVQAVKDECTIFIRRAFSAWKQFDLLFWFSQDYKLHKKSLKILHNFTNSVIASRKKELENKTDENYEETNDIGIKKKAAFLDLLLESTIDGKPLSNEDVREEVDTFMFAGHDTTSSCLCFCLYEIANNSHVQKKMLEEVNTVLEKEQRPLTFRDLNEMKYLEMVIKEGLRMYPSVPYYARELKEDVNYNGMILPKGLTVDVFTYYLHKNPDVFPNPEKFDPDRFLSENVQSRGPYSYIPFSAGPRNCIGQKFAMLELKATLAKIILNFELSPANPEYKPIISGEAVLKPANGLFVRLKKRD